MAPSDRTPSRRDVLRTAGAGIVGGLAATGTAATADGHYTMEFFEDRMYRKYVPPNLGDSGERPLLVVLHGCGEDPHTIKEITGYNELADDEEFVVIYPEQPLEANADYCWNWFQDENTTRGNGEARLIAGMAEQELDREPLDADRVYVTGLSAGAAMVPNLLAEYPDVFAAGGIHSGLEYDAAENSVGAVDAMATGGPDPQKQGTKAYERMAAFDVVSRIPTVVFHGTEDSVVAPVNGRQCVGQANQTNDLATDGEDDDDVDDTADETTTGTAEEYDYTVKQYEDGDGETVVESWFVEGMGHGWSGGDPDYDDSEPGGPDASRAIWEFCKGKTR